MKFTTLLAAGALVLSLASCDQPPRDTAARADQIAHETIIADTHIDVPYRLRDGWEDVSRATEKGDFDYPRAIAGGLDVAFMSIYTPAELGDGPEATAHAEQLIDMVEKIVAGAPDKFALAYSVAEVEHNFAQGLVSLPLGMENGSPIAGDMENLQHFFERGIRYITLAHSKANHISDSSYDENRPNGGLSPFGEEVVREMNRLGIMVDISHLSDQAFWDVLEVTSVPVIASHSSLRHFTPGFERNMSDEMVKALAGNGGVVMINFGSAFLTRESNEKGTAYYEAYQAHIEETGTEDTPDAVAAFRAEYFGDEGFPYATLEDVLDHIDRVVELAGVDHVGLGSDFDGVGDSLPVGLKDVSDYPNLVEGLLKRGYSEQEIGKILSGNILRVWRAVEAAAQGAAN